MCQERRGDSGLQLCHLETIWVALREQIMQSPPNTDHLNSSQFDTDKKLLKGPEDERKASITPYINHIHYALYKPVPWAS